MIGTVNATFDRNAALGLFRVIKKVGSRTSWLRVTAVESYLILESGPTMATVEAMVLEPGQFMTNRRAFEQLLRSFTSDDVLTLQADPSRFRIGSFSGQLADYRANPKMPEGLKPSTETAE